MSTRTRIILFGMASGLLWSVAPIYFSGRDLESFYVYPTLGIITGIVVSFTLYKPLLRLKLRGALCLGLLAFPLGVFYFGLVSGLAELLRGNVIADSSGSFLSALFYYALDFMYVIVMMSLSYTGLILFSSAVITTYLLRLTIHHGGGQDKSPATT